MNVRSWMERARRLLVGVAAAPHPSIPPVNRENRTEGSTGAISRPWAAFAFLSAIYVLGAGALARRFPPVNTDEVVSCVHGVNLIGGAGQRYSLYDDIFAPAVYPLRDIFSDIARTFYNAWVGLWWYMTPGSCWHVRLSSVCAGWAALLGLFLLGRRQEGAGGGLLMFLLLAVHPVFLAASCVARPEIVLLAAGVPLALWGAEAGGGRYKSVLLGLGSGALAGVHPNAFPLSLGLLAAHLAGRPDWRPNGVRWLGGYIVGIVTAFITVDTSRFALSLKYYLYYRLVSPPILSFPWSPWDWIRKTSLDFVRGDTFYFNLRLVPGWEGGLRWSWAAVGFLVLWGAFQEIRGGRWTPRRRLLLGFLAAFAGAAALVRRSEAVYSVLFLPFLVPAAASTWRTGWHLGGWRRTAICASALSLALGLFNFIAFSVRYRKTAEPIDEIERSLRVVVPDRGMKVAGPNVLWFFWDHGKFRDAGALVFSRWYTGGRRDVGSWLGNWKPDVFVVDDAFRRVFLKGSTLSALMGDALTESPAFLGSLDTGPGAYGTWDVYRLRWKAKETGT